MPPMSYKKKTRPRIVKRVLRAGGGPAVLARKLSDRRRTITRMAVSQWRAVPRRWHRRVAKITGIPVAELQQAPS